MQQLEGNQGLEILDKMLEILFYNLGYEKQIVNLHLYFWPMQNTGFLTMRLMLSMLVNFLLLQKIFQYFENLHNTIV